MYDDWKLATPDYFLSEDDEEVTTKCKFCFEPVEEKGFFVCNECQRLSLENLID